MIMLMQRETLGGEEAVELKNKKRVHAFSLSLVLFSLCVESIMHRRRQICKRIFKLKYIYVHIN